MLNSEKYYISLLVIVFLIISAESAEAARRNYGSSWYVGLGAYAAMQEDSTISGATGTGSTDDGDWVLNSASLYLGYRPQMFFNAYSAFRFEIEANARNFSLGQSSGSGFSVTDFDEGLRVASLMANAYVDIHLTSHITPYVGIGYGYATGQIQDDPAQGLLENDSNERVPAYQIMAGVALTPEGLPNTEWVFGYNRFTITEGLEFDGASSMIVVDDLQADSLHAGLRIFF